MFFSRNMHMYLYKAEDVDIKVQYVQAALSSQTITLQEQTDYIYVMMSKMIINAIRWCHIFINNRKLWIVFSFVFVH